MFILLYPISLLLCLLSLALWFFYQSRPLISRILRTIFFISLAVYLIAVGLLGGSWEDKGTVLFRDLIILGVTPVLLSFFRKRSLIYFILLALAAVGIGTYVSSQLPSLQEQQTQPINTENEWELLVEVKEGKSLSSFQEIINRYGLIFETAFELKHGEYTDLDDYYAVEIPEKWESEQPAIMKALMDSGFVDWVEENETISVELPTPARQLPGINRKFGVDDPGLIHLWGFEVMNVQDLYSLMRTKKVKPRQKTLIAILDTGIDKKHEDLKGNYKSLNASYDKDVRQHGTHCAGIAASVTNNGLGIASFAPDNRFVEVTSIKVLSDFGSGTQRGIINGMLEAADAGAGVVSMSLGGRSSQSKQRAYQQAVSYINKAGGIVIAAAGNNNSNASYTAPANTPGIIAVAAVDTLLHRASFSNKVQDLTMAVAAPGVNIYSTIPGNEYAAFNGTSMATPYVAGLVGVMKAIKPELNTREVFDILKQTGKPTLDPDLTGPLIQPAAAIEKILKD
jgi:thermitase